MNAYEDGRDRIVLDVVRHPKMFDTDRLGPNEGPPTLDRWTIDRTGGKVVEERLDDHGQEFPRVDERLTGRRHRYGYSVGFGAVDDHVDFRESFVMKHDMAGQTTLTRPFGPGSSASEFVFVPNGPDSAEDDGVLMGFVYDAASDRSGLRMLDAGTLEPVAAIHLPARVPQGFHGNWIAD
jgi:carotenoid cleavage dioxygenase